MSSTTDAIVSAIISNNAGEQLHAYQHGDAKGSDATDEKEYLKALSVSLNESQTAVNQLLSDMIAAEPKKDPPAKRTVDSKKSDARGKEK
ncbi:hypothetical protein SARC_05623, partial [Sphaeroforma arctica JP610]